MANQSQLPDPKQLPMVGWYDPRQLAKTGVEVAISTIFGRHSDQRLVEAMASGHETEPDYYDYTYSYNDDGKGPLKTDPGPPRDSIWVDYVGDVGDGWNSTYAVAYYLTQGGSFKYSDGKNEFDTTITQRGDILIFGGDEVYPTASREVYKDRLLVPYQAATRTRGEWSRPGPYSHVFAIPGNHDWYDSLVAFTRLFTSSRWFGDWRTRQSRSYFALKLPHNWWLLGTDVQLGSDIDRPQLEYFEKLRKHMAEEEAKTNEPATIILCHAEPHWIRAWQYEGIDPTYTESNLKVLERRLGKNVAVYIAGDLHHYRRHEARNQSTQKITAGGGGAFLHPTHPGLLGKKFDTIFEKELDGKELDTANPKLADELPPDQVFKLKGCFPSTKDSSRVCWRNLIFPYLKGNASRTFGLVIAALYLLLTLGVIARVDDPDLHVLRYTLGDISYTVLATMLGSSLTMSLVVATVVGFVFFTDTHSVLYRIVMGGLHGILHVLAAFTLALLCIHLIADSTDPKSWIVTVPWGAHEFHPDLRVLVAAVIIFVGGFIVGSFIMGLYLLVSLNFFGRHGNEAFSSLGIEDWKNFLRLQIDTNGNLTIYPIGIKRVPRKWKGGAATGPELVPDEQGDPKATKPRLIEEPIFIMKDRSTDTGAKKKPSPTGD